MAADEDRKMLSRFVYDEIRARILDGRLVAGEPVRERELATELAVSRVPIREAMPWLELSGLVVLSPRRPAVVTTITRRDVDELYDIRSALEPLVARRAAAQVAGGADPTALTTIVAEAASALVRDDLLAVHRANGRIHGAIESLADNRLFVSTMGPLNERSNRLNVANIHSDPTRRHTEHVALAEAITHGDTELASSIAHAHVEWGRARTIETLAQVPGFTH